MTLKELARWYEDRLITGKRADGKEYYKFKDDNQEHEKQCRALALAAHSDGCMLPDDWRYQFIFEALSALSETSDPDDVQIDADVYTSDLTDWLASRNDRISFCDEAVKEGLIEDDVSMCDRLSAGQYMEKREVLDQVRAYLESEIETINESEEVA